MKSFFRATILGLAAGISILIVVVLDRGSAVRHVVDNCFTAVNTPLGAFLAGTTLEQNLRQAQDPLKTILVLGLWWGILGTLIAVVAHSIYRVARRRVLRT